MERDLDDELDSVISLGTPIRKPSYIGKHALNRIKEEQLLLHELVYLKILNVHGPHRPGRRCLGPII